MAIDVRLRPDYQLTQDESPIEGKNYFSENEGEYTLIDPAPNAFDSSENYYEYIYTNPNAENKVTRFFLKS